LPNFIRFFCQFSCNDDIRNIITHNNNISDYKICSYGNEEIGILVMKEYILGSFSNYNWNGDNFNIFKNTIKQVAFASILAYNFNGFIHGDLHSGNVLLKPKRKDKIEYGEKSLELDELEVVIMDFEKSKLYESNEMTRFIRNIIKFFDSAISCYDTTRIIYYDKHSLIKLKDSPSNNIDFYNQIENIIDNMQLY